MISSCLCGSLRSSSLVEYLAIAIDLGWRWCAGTNETPGRAEADSRSNAIIAAAAAVAAKKRDFMSDECRFRVLHGLPDSGDQDLRACTSRSSDALLQSQRSVCVCVSVCFLRRDFCHTFSCCPARVHAMFTFCLRAIDFVQKRRQFPAAGGMGCSGGKSASSRPNCHRLVICYG